MNSPEYENLQRIIREYVKENKITYEELAERSGLSATCIRNWAAGKSQPVGLSIVMLARAMGCSVEHLYGLDDWQQGYIQKAKDTIDAFAAELKKRMESEIEAIANEMKGEEKQCK